MEPLSNEQDSSNQPALSPFSFEGASTSSSNPNESRSLRSSTSTHSIDLANGHTEVRNEDVISPGPVRTVQLQRQSVIGGKPRYVISDTQQHALDPRIFIVENERSLLHSDTDVATTRSSGSNGPIWLTLVVTTLIIAGLFGFLCYLWISRDSIWHSIVASGRMVKTTTIVATIIWLAVESQAVLAGLMLYCCQSSSLSRHKEYASLRDSKRSESSRSVITIGLLLLLVSLALHFAPTMLLSDLENGTLAVRKTHAQEVAYGLTDELKLNITRGEVDYSSIDPGQLLQFAEISKPAPALQQGVDDTGDTMRASLPLASAQGQESIASYEGVATIVNSRVICMAPGNEDVTYISTGPSTSPASPAQHVQGTLTVPTSRLDGLSFDSGLEGGIAFDCGLQLAQTDNEAPISMCSAGNFAGSVQMESQFLDGGAAEAATFVMVDHTRNNTIPISGWVGEGDAANPHNVSISEWNIAKSGAWTNLTYAPNPIFSIQLSLCFVATTSVNAEVIVRAADAQTRKIPSTSNPGSIYDTDVSGYLRQLGVDPSLSHEERAIMSLELKAGETPTQMTNTSSSLDKIFGQNVTYGLCTHCGGYNDDDSAHGIANTLSIVFQRAIEESGSPAKALQAIFTLARSEQYRAR